MQAEKKSIKNWNEEDQPREKLLKFGKQHLSNAELIAILIGSGNRDESAVDLSKRILERVDNNLATLGKLQLSDLQKFKGIGEAKAITLLACLELGRRRQAENLAEINKITTSKDAYHVLLPMLADLPYEEFWVLYLNKGNSIIKKEKLSSGGIDGTAVDVRMIMKNAIDFLATAIIIAHNHPSGNLKPSEADKKLTDKLLQAGKILEVRLIDHIIVSSNGFYSFADEGILS